MFALENAHTKASEIAENFSYKLVRPIWLHEEDLVEVKHNSKELVDNLPFDCVNGDNAGNSINFNYEQQGNWDVALNAATITMKASVAACFEMAPRIKKVQSDVRR